MSEPQIKNQQLASDVSRPNQLVNPGFENWQRGNGPFTASSALAADRWVINLAGTDTLSVSKDTANVDPNSGSIACAACTFVLGNGAGLTFFSSNGHAIVDGQQITNRIMSLSVRVRTAVPNAVRVGIYSGAAWTYSGYHSGSGLYETLTATLALPGAGTSLGSVGAFFAASCTAYIDNAMLVFGSIAPDYQPLTPADDFSRCQRYYELVGQGSNSSIAIQLNGIASQYTELLLQFKVQKAVIPTITKNGTWSVINSGQPLVANADVSCCNLYCLVTASGLFQFVNNGTNTYISIEANP